MADYALVRFLKNNPFNKNTIVPVRYIRDLLAEKCKKEDIILDEQMYIVKNDKEKKWTRACIYKFGSEEELKAEEEGLKADDNGTDKIPKRRKMVRFSSSDYNKTISDDEIDPSDQSMDQSTTQSKSKNGNKKINLGKRKAATGNENKNKKGNDAIPNISTPISSQSQQPSFDTIDSQEKNTKSSNANKCEEELPPKKTKTTKKRNSTVIQQSSNKSKKIFLQYPKNTNKKSTTVIQPSYNDSEKVLLQSPKNTNKNNSTVIQQSSNENEKVVLQSPKNTNKKNIEGLGSRNFYKGNNISPLPQKKIVKKPVNIGSSLQFNNASKQKTAIRHSNLIDLLVDSAIESETADVSDESCSDDDDDVSNEIKHNEVPRMNNDIVQVSPVRGNGSNEDLPIQPTTPRTSGPRRRLVLNPIGVSLRRDMYVTWTGNMRRDNKNMNVEMIHLGKGVSISLENWEQALKLYLTRYKTTLVKKHEDVLSCLKDVNAAVSEETNFQNQQYKNGTNEEPQEPICIEEDINLYEL
uniref:Uncharacterized protein n=1 Tax=Trichogramma kaykai TaxID=54128 RepID=A0ABD2WH59_9HYME